MDRYISIRHEPEVYLVFTRGTEVPCSTCWHIAGCHWTEIPTITTPEEMCAFVNKFTDLNWTPRVELVPVSK